MSDTDPTSPPPEPDSEASPVKKGHIAPPVVFADGDSASGMAIMLGDLLRDNLRDFPGRARCARRLRGSVVLTAADRDRSVTLTFAPDQVTVTDGATPGISAISGTWKEMAQLCSGRLSPANAIVQRKLAVSRPFRPALLAGSGYVLSVPPSYYGEERKVEPWQIAVGTTLLVGLVLIGSRRVRQRRRRQAITFQNNGLPNNG